MLKKIIFSLFFLALMGCSSQKEEPVKRVEGKVFENNYGVVYGFEQ